MTGTIKPRPQKIPKKKGIPFVPFIMFLLIIALVTVYFWQKKSTKKTPKNFTVVRNTQMDTTVVAKPDTMPVVKSDSIAQIKPPATVPENQTTTIVAAPQQSAINYNDYTQRYERAMSLFHSENYSEAMKEFNSLVTEFPNHSYTVNCQYWIGECYFGLANYKTAMDLFQKVLSLGTSDKNDDAVMMIGRCYYKMNDYTNARFYFNRLINEYPYSEYVEKARSHLVKMN